MSKTKLKQLQSNLETKMIDDAEDKVSGYIT